MNAAIVIGAGGHAKVLIDALRCMNVSILGLVDPMKERGETLWGLPVLGGDESVSDYSPLDVFLVNGIGSVCNTGLRQKIFEKFKSSEYTFMTVIHPSAVIASDVSLEEGVQIMAGVVIQTGCHIQKNTLINTRASLDHDCVIAEHVHIAPGVIFSGSVEVGSGSHIGTGAVVIQNIKIAGDCLIGAGTLVRKNIVKNSRFLG